MSAPKVAVVDYGVGNLLSVSRALSACGANVDLTSSTTAVANADRVVLPGVGAFGQCVDRLRERGFEDALRRFVDRGRPLLGICVGMQMLMTRSNEFGDHAGLGFIAGDVGMVPRSSSPHRSFKVPHIGWFPLRRPEGSAPASWHGTPLAEVDEGVKVYFLHSYQAQPVERPCLAAEYEVEGRLISAAIRKNNIFGTQFHPEKSGQTGLQIMKTFLSLT